MEMHLVRRYSMNFSFRDRDSMSQVRVAIDELVPALREKLGA